MTERIEPGFSSLQEAIADKRQPKDGWNQEIEIERAIEFARTLDDILFDSEEEARCFSGLYGYGMDIDYAMNIIVNRWPNLRKEPRMRTGICRRLIEFYCDQPFRAGGNCAGMEFEGVDRKTLVRSVGGLSFSYGDEIVAKPLEWLWTNRIPGGKLTLIAGFPDQGKSQILLSMIAQITTGGEWPNGEGRADRGLAIVLSAEDDEADTLIPRLHAAGADIKNLAIIRPMVMVIEHGNKRRRVLNIEEDLKKISVVMNQMEERLGLPVVMVAFDPLNAYFGGGKKADVHKDADMRALLTPITEWCTQRRIAAVGIMHFNKGSNSHTLHRVTGSGAITAAARSVHFVIKHEETGKRVMVPGKHNLARDAIKGLEYELVEEDVSAKTGVPDQRMPHVRWCGESALTAEQALGEAKPGRKSSNATADAVMFLEDLLAAGPMPAKDVLKAGAENGHAANAIKEAKARLDVESKKADFGEGWHWSLPDHSANAVNDFEDSDA